MSQTFLQINPTDNLLVALQDLPKGTIIQHNGNEIKLQDDIAAKHKFTTEAIAKEGKATMYGVLVGLASQDIPKGGLIHTFNLHHAATDFVGKQKDSVGPKDLFPDRLSNIRPCLRRVLCSTVPCRKAHVC